MFWIDKGAAKFLENHSVQFVRDRQGFVTALRLLPTFIATYGPVSARLLDPILEEALARLAEGIKNDIARAGLERNGVFPPRTAPNDIALREMLMARWQSQKGMCALCDRLIPLRPMNRLLQMSRDRTDSANKTYDWRNTAITHLACNLGKTNASVEEWREYLSMLRCASTSAQEPAE